MAKYTRVRTTCRRNWTIWCETKMVELNGIMYATPWCDKILFGIVVHRGEVSYKADDILSPFAKYVLEVLSGELSADCKPDLYINDTGLYVLYLDVFKKIIGCKKSRRAYALLKNTVDKLHRLAIFNNFEFKEGERILTWETGIGLLKISVTASDSKLICAALNERISQYIFAVKDLEEKPLFRDWMREVSINECADIIQIP